MHHQRHVLFRRGKAATSPRCFTLVELVVAMTILVIMMLMLFQFLIAAQRFWSINESSTQIYENSRVTLEILERDLRAALASTIADKEIGFYVGDPDSTNDYLHGLQFCCVSSSEPHDVADSRLCEISYRHEGADGDDPFTLKRQAVADTDSANWDFTGRPANWFVNNNVSSDLASYETVIRGVVEFNVECYDRDGRVMDRGTDYTTMPNRVEINMVLCDEKLIDAPEPVRFRTQRSFTKIFYLGDIRTN